MKPFCLFIFLFCTTFSKAHAQQLRKKNFSVGLQTYYGSFLTNEPKAAYLRDSYTSFTELVLQQQTDGSKGWHTAHRLPQVGLAFFYGHTGSRQYLGSMAGAFPFVNMPLFKSRIATSSLRVGAGLGWVQKPYDKTVNHKNVLIGSHINAYLHFLWQNEILVFKNVHVNGGISFSHLSNGGTTLPNLGLNIPALSLGLRYSFAPTATSSVPKVSFTKKSVVTLFTTAGVKQFPWVEGRRYLINTIHGEWSRNFTHSSRYGGGVVLLYNRAMQVDPAGILDNKIKGKNLQAGIYAAYEHQFGALSVPVHLGATLYNPGINPFLFQQLGFRYHITPQWRAQFLMKNHLGKADFIHLGIGYQFK